MEQEFNEHEHTKKRAKTYNEINSFWHDLNDSEYGLYDMAFLSEQDIEDIQLVTERVGKVFFKTANLLRNSPDETLLQLDIPKSVLPFIRHKALPVETIIARVDLVKTKEGLKVLELNSDTPTFEKEVFHVNNYLCHEFDVTDPNEGLAAILGIEMRKALGEALHRTQFSNHPNIVFTSHDQNEEDKLTTQFLMETSNVSAKYVPLHKLTIKKNEGLYDDEGNKIDVLYRQTYPLEHLLEDVSSETGEYIGVQLIELVFKNKLIMLNPISAFLLQSKAVQAVIWGMKEIDSPYFTTEEKQWIHDYFLPTYLEEDLFLSKGWKYVKKPSYGREGDTVSIFQGTKKLVEDQHHTYEQSLPVYQKYVELPSQEIKTVTGVKEAKILIGSFLINGKACGIGLRAGNQITDNNAYFLPVGIKKERRD